MRKLYYLLIGQSHIKSVDIRLRCIIKPNLHLIHIFSEKVPVAWEPAILGKVPRKVRKLTTRAVLAKKGRIVV